MRVSDNTSAGSVKDALRRTRGRLERLQIQNATQKKLVTPSDDPAGNSKILDIRTQATVNSQFANNGAMAKNRLQFADTALNELYDIFVRAKEIAINQSSGASASVDSRLGVAQEVTALYQQLLSIANRRVGEQYLFGGFKTLSAPYTPTGEYRGDNGEMPIEIQKGVYVPINVPGPVAFQIQRYKSEDQARSPAAVDKTQNSAAAPGEPPPSEQQGVPSIETIDAFKEIDALRVGLLTNDTITIRDTMERLDELIKNTITVRAKVSARSNSIDQAIGASEKADLSNAELATQIEDADYTELWSNLAKEETILRSSLSAAQKLIQPTLLDFLK
ncbi:MAG TPA: flagellar hook-associated protein FlgL [Oligoflexia bacterium]|nr:flagellar hook-associated protein FlgL [Oligoflexia bacterium]